MAELPALGEALYALTQKRLEQSTLQQAMSRIGFSIDPYEETFRKMSEWSLELGYSRRKPDLSKLIDATILERVKLGQAGGGA